MELRRYAAIIWRWSWLLVLGTVLAATAAYLVFSRKTPVYEARSTILVNQAQAATGPSYQDVLANQQISKTYAQLILSGPVLAQVGQNTGVAPAELGQLVSARVRRDTNLIDITVRNTSPELAARIANETATVFSNQIRQAQLGQQTNAEEDLEKQIAAVQKSIDEKSAAVSRLATPQLGVPDDQRRQQQQQVQVEVDALRQNQATLQRRLQDLRVELARSINSVTLADPATPPVEPVSPRVTLNTILGALLGLALAGGIIAVIEYLDDTVKSADEVNRAVGASTLGAISAFGGRGTRRGRRGIVPRLLTNMDGRSTIAEAYRMVRTNLEFSRSGRPNKTMLVTSALPGEGKSTTTANLALVLAQTGQRVILVDADMRRPTQHRLFDLPNTAGLSTLFVMDDPAIDGFLRMTPLDNLLVLPSGPLPPNPAELLSSARMEHILGLLREHADIVLFDSPPLLGVADSSALAAKLDGVVLVIDSGRTRKAVLTHAVEVLGRAQATLWGVVLNKLKARRGDGSYYYYYSYRYYGHDDSGSAPPPAATGPDSKRTRRGQRPDASLPTRAASLIDRPDYPERQR